MRETHLNVLALANILKEREINVDEIIDLFSKMKPMRMVYVRLEHRLIGMI